MLPEIPRKIVIPPSASALVQSLRGLGYTPETALADLIDNSITAEASAIEVTLDWNCGKPLVAVLDDGAGLDHDGLVRAMCFGGSGPSSARCPGDLGRFGLGLKTASLSQSSRMTVISRRNDKISAMTWDADILTENGWDAVIPDSLPEIPQVQQLLASAHGTLVLWDRMDSIGGLSGLDKESFFLHIQDIREHIGMVFHRFLGGDARRISISINRRPVRPWDPFQKTHPATITMQTERLRLAGLSLTVAPFVLPHRDRFANDEQYELAGGPGGWGARQGFYVYRAKRLLVPGSWLGLGPAKSWAREEPTRLARIAIDLPTEMDAEWRIDVRKSQARPPGQLRPRLMAIGGACRDKAREIFAWRGARSRSSGRTQDSPPIWIALGGNSNILRRYRINRKHPAVIALKSRIGDAGELLEALLTLSECTVPVERIWLDISESESSPLPKIPPEDVKFLAAQLVVLAEALPAELTTEERINLLTQYLPGDQSELRLALAEQLKSET